MLEVFHIEIHKKLLIYNFQIVRRIRTQNIANDPIDDNMPHLQESFE